MREFGSRHERLCARRMDELERAQVDAEAVFAGGAYKALSVDGPGQVHMQVSALGEVGEKTLQRIGPLLEGGGVGTCGARLRRGRRHSMARGQSGRLA